MSCSSQPASKDCFRWTDDGPSFLSAARNEDNDQCTVQHCAAFQGACCRERCILK